jgi:hypothetical protein
MRTTAVFVGAPVTRMASSRSSASISSVVLMHKESHISYASVKSLLRASPRLLTRPKSIEKRGVCGIRVLTGAHQIRDGPRICRIFKHLNLVPTWSLGLPRSDLSLEGDQQGARPLFENKGLDTIVLTLRDDAVGAPFTAGGLRRLITVVGLPTEAIGFLKKEKFLWMLQVGRYT